MTEDKVIDTHVLSNLSIRMAPASEADDTLVAWFFVEIDGKEVVNAPVSDAEGMCEWLLGAMMNMAPHFSADQLDRFRAFCVEKELWEPKDVSEE